MALDGGPVAPGHRAGEGGGRAEGGDVVDGAPDQGEEGLERARPSGATRSTWPSRATRWFEAMTAAAW